MLLSLVNQVSRNYDRPVSIANNERTLRYTGAMDTNETTIVPSFDNAPIGVFDSGFGGLTVAREIAKELPRESIV